MKNALEVSRFIISTYPGCDMVLEMTARAFWSGIRCRKQSALGSAQNSARRVLPCAVLAHICAQNARSIWRQVTCVVRCGACASGQSNIVLSDSGTSFNVTGPFTGADSLVLPWVVARQPWPQGSCISTSLQHVQLFDV